MSAFTGGLARARELLIERFGHAAFRAHQVRVLGPLLAGRSVLAVLPTGAGKSLCYQLPALMAPGLRLVVSPLISLMQDQVARLRRRGIAAAYLNSLLRPEQRRIVLDAALHGRLKLLYCAPERLGALVPRLVRAAQPVSLLAVDEAHCIVEWGNEFRPVYRRLGEYRYRLQRPPTIALTGSATPAARAFGMGIDKPDVRLVLHWGPPPTLEAYYQEAGRAGRDGRRAACVMLWRPGDLAWGNCSPAMRRYVEARACRRRLLLAYFGEPAARCSGCDRCGMNRAP